MQILLVAAEASSVLYAERLIQEAQRENSGVSFFGVGNKSMENIGFRRIGKSEEMAVVGIF
ncbi:MAG TPA: lipid-A-disaccharide synthase, partial [Pseudobdellovibrionaceae bacterium]|nr:lipid-A-disaccharide synthase [Pseudobdellovibrionaceae bacterium]